jgi:methylamine utilization protein MauJ
MPVLSRWSFVHDVAITTSAVHIEEIATGMRGVTMTMLGAGKVFSDRGAPSTAEHRVLLSSYREGVSSAEPLWQALSLYKVAEGVWTLRARRRVAAIAAGLAVDEVSERVPNDVSTLGHPNDHEALERALAPYAGKKFRGAFDDIRATLRNGIAHLDPDGDPLVQDSWDDIQRIRDVLPGLRWMSRRLLEAELATVAASVTSCQA